MSVLIEWIGPNADNLDRTCQAPRFPSMVAAVKADDLVKYLSNCAEEAGERVTCRTTTAGAY